MKNTRFLPFVFILSLGLFACNLTAPQDPPTPLPFPTDSPILFTPIPVTNTPPATVPPTLPPSSPTPRPAPSNTALPAPTSSACTNSADFVTDISIPDGAKLESNLSFVKTWRIKNTGTCTWNSNYSLVFVDGTLMMPVNYAPLPGVIAPGQVFDLSLNMTSPIYPGRYESDWKFRTPNGSLFGVGGNHSPLWVKIVIGEPDSTRISGLVYQDRNDNGQFDGNDILMANREVWLQQSACGSQGGTRLETAWSNDQGQYEIDGSFEGTYCVVLGGIEAPEDSHTVSIAAGQTMNHIDLRATSPVAQIAGSVWDTTSEQVGMTGVVVTIQRGACGSPLSVSVSAITDQAGHYVFDSLYGGVYCVSIRIYEGGNQNIFTTGGWVYPENGIQEIVIQPGQEGIADFAWKYK